MKHEVSDWYETVVEERSLQQGDIFFKLPVPIISENIYASILDRDYRVGGSAQLVVQDMILMSQTCDLENGKIEHVNLCAVGSLKSLVETVEFYKSSKARENLRRGLEPSYHMINSFPKEGLPVSVVDFRRVYTFPKMILGYYAETLRRRVRMKSPYREHLSQAFASYFMRVGLPSSIDRDEVRNIRAAS